ncbi:hypothetical protein BHE74_00031834 [Ensete ventricosum]|nr:hypothetical protein GW17_00012042 [Ensete ventricosum]RWW61125.1 hypothetical protein BHE74_00031834 [Ensete ventricosum]
MGAKSVLKTTHGSVCSLQEITAPCWNNTSRKISFAFSINTRDGNENLQPVFLKNHWTWWHCHLEDEVDAGSDMLDWTWTPSDDYDFASSALLCVEDNSCILGFDDGDGDNDEYEEHTRGCVSQQKRCDFYGDFLTGFPLQSDECLAFLVERESAHMPREDYAERLRSGSLDLSIRRDAIDWILKVVSRDEAFQERTEVSDMFFIHFVNFPVFSSDRWARQNMYLKLGLYREWSSWF